MTKDLTSTNTARGTVNTPKLYVVIAFIVILAVSHQLPAQQPSWQQTNGPFGGRVNALMTTRTGAVIAGTVKGIFRTTDEGMTWRRSYNDSLLETKYSNVESFAADSMGTLYAAATFGIFSSNDDGIHWKQIGPEFPYVEAVAIAFDNTNTMYVSGRGRIFQLADSGIQYWRVITTLPTAMIYALTFDTDGALFAGAWTGGVFRSTDHGLTWSSSSNGLSCLNVRCVIRSEHGDLLATTSCGLWRTSDDGANWRMVKGAIEGRDVYRVAVDRGMLYATTYGFGIFRSSDDGTSWQQMYVGIENQDVWAFTAAANGDIYCGTSHGVERSTDQGEHWQVSDNGLIATDVQTVIVNRKGYVYAGTETGIFRSTDRGNSWQGINYLLTNRHIRCLAVDSTDDLWAGTAYGAVFRSTDDGESWQDTHLDASTWVEAIAIDRNNTVIAGTSEGGRINRYNRDSATWTVTSDRIFVMGLGIGRGNYLYATAWNDGVYRSSNYGATWYRIYDAPHFKAIRTNSKGQVFIGYYDCFCLDRSDDDGRTWNDNGDRQGVPGIRSIAIDQRYNMIVGTAAGAYRSTNSGDNWESDSVGLGNKGINAVEFTGDGTAYAGTGGWGVYRKNADPSSSISAEQKTNELASSVSITPNPCTSVASVSCTLDQPSKVTVTVTNSVGMAIMTPVAENCDIGEHRWNLDTSVLPAGPYFLRIVVGGHHSSSEPLLVVH